MKQRIGWAHIFDPESNKKINFLPIGFLWNGFWFWGTPEPICKSGLVKKALKPMLSSYAALKKTRKVRSFQEFKVEMKIRCLKQWFQQSYFGLLLWIHSIFFCRRWESLRICWHSDHTYLENISWNSKTENSITRKLQYKKRPFRTLTFWNKHDKFVQSSVKTALMQSEAQSVPQKKTN